MGQFDKAIADTSAALAINPKRAASLYVRGVARRRLNDVAAAMLISGPLSSSIRRLRKDTQGTESALRGTNVVILFFPEPIGVDIS